MTPVIALVGRPNVGKSTLFNRLTRSRDALVADFPGLTRDRKYGNGQLGDKAYTVIDTGGISGDEQGIDAAMAEQSLTAIDEADIVLFLVDARAGLMPADQAIANHLRVNQKKTWLVVNKTDGLDEQIGMADFWGLGLGDPRPIAASHGRNVTTLIDEVLEPFPARDPLAGPQGGHPGVHIGVIGRPNVGKSTLVNRMLGEDRVVVFDEAGTTRDAIEIPFERRGKPYVLVDTRVSGGARTSPSPPRSSRSSRPSRRSRSATSRSWSSTPAAAWSNRICTCSTTCCRAAARWCWR